MFEMTLPTIGELDEMDELSITTLYRIEIHRLREVEDAEEQALYERARQGDQEARFSLLFHCLPYVFAKAFHIFDERQPAHIDLMDLVGEANLTMLEEMDTALAKRDPIPYLIAIAVKHMERYCTYNAPLIQRPFGLSSDVLSRRQQYTSLESLDAPISLKEDVVFYVDRIQAPVPPSTMEDEAYLNARFSPLYEAVKQLAAYQRTPIIRFYGLFDQPASTALELSKEWHTTTGTVNANKRRGLQKLREILADSLYEMLSWSKEAEGKE